VAPLPYISPKTMQNLRIVRSGISVYEVEVDLGGYADRTTDKIRGFVSRLLRMFPSLRKHECYAGEAGGFVDELRLGTDLAHVMEHLILELIKVASSTGHRFSGWTRKKGKHYVIHFQAPDASMGRCAAAGALGIIESILKGKRVQKKAVIKAIRDSREVGPCN
jgi:cyanophycin synthetase